MILNLLDDKGGILPCPFGEDSMEYCKECPSAKSVKSNMVDCTREKSLVPLGVKCGDIVVGEGCQDCKHFLSMTTEAVYCGKMITNEKGGKKANSGKLQWLILPWTIFPAVIRVLMYGAKKYGKENWKLVDIKDYEEAFMRHWFEYIQDFNKVDPDTGESHLAHAMCCLMFIMYLRGVK